MTFSATNPAYPTQLRPVPHAIYGSDGRTRVTLCIMASAPDVCSISLSCGPWSGDVNMAPAELRQLAAQLLAAAEHIEGGAS